MGSCDDHDAGVKCRDEQRVRNVTAHIVNTPITSTVYAVLVTWDQNLTVKEPTSFKVECHNEQLSIIIIVGNKMVNTQLGGLFSSCSYNCCVTAMYPPYYEDKEICTGINATSNIIKCTSLSEISAASMCNNQSTNSATIIIEGVLGITIVILLSLLSLSLVCVVQQYVRKRVISERYVKLHYPISYCWINSSYVRVYVLYSAIIPYFHEHCVHDTASSLYLKILSIQTK